MAFEGLGYIETWATQNRHILSSSKFFEKEFAFPNLSDFDWPIIMGGQMGVYDEEKYTWLKPEKEFILKSIEADKNGNWHLFGLATDCIGIGSKRLSEQ